jgi:peroxiredoxin
MKKLMIPIVALGLFSACSGNSSADIPGHLIKGKIENAEDQEVIAIVFEDGEEKGIDTVKIVDGEFTIETPTKKLREYILTFGESEMPIVLFLDEESENIEITGSLPNVGENYTITGTKYSQDIKEYLVYLKPYFETERGIYMNLQQTNPMDTVAIEKYMGQLDSISAIQREYAIEHIEKDFASPVSWLMLREMFPASGLANFNLDDIQYFEKVAKAIREKYPYSEYPDLIEKDIEQIKSQLEMMKMQDVELSEAPEINLNNVDGEPLALSSLKGKVVLVDFWASWCKPCRQENPNVVAAYNKYKDKGFTVYSVSLDDKKDAWLNAIQSDNLTWPNHVSDLQGCTSATTPYGVSSIPSTFLLDKDGNIIARNLRGDQLEKKLAEILG